MKCPKCGGKTRVRDNVNNEKTNERYRQRKCLECGHTFYTIEFEVDDDTQFRKDWIRNHRHGAYINSVKQKPRNIQKKSEVDNKHKQRDITTENVCLNNITYEVTKEYFTDRIGHYEFKVTPKRGAELVVYSMVSDECMGAATIMERGINASSKYRLFVVYPANK